MASLLFILVIYCYNIVLKKANTVNKIFCRTILYYDAFYISNVFNMVFTHIQLLQYNMLLLIMYLIKNNYKKKMVIKIAQSHEFWLFSQCKAFCAVIIREQQPESIFHVRHSGNLPAQDPVRYLEIIHHGSSGNKLYFQIQHTKVYVKTSQQHPWNTHRLHTGHVNVYINIWGWHATVAPAFVLYITIIKTPRNNDGTMMFNPLIKFKDLENKELPMLAAQLTFMFVFPCVTHLYVTIM